MQALLAIWLCCAALRAAPQDEAPRAPAAARFEFTTLGDKALSRCDLLAEARAAAARTAARGVCVVRFEISELLLGESGRAEVVVLAAPGEFSAGATYLLFLERFQEGPRFTAFARIAGAERDYAAKLKVLRRFAEAERVVDEEQRALLIREILLLHLGDEDLFVKWNALAEIKSFAGLHAALFGAREKARLVEVLRGEVSPTFRRGLLEVLEQLGVRFGEKARPESGGGEGAGQAPPLEQGASREPAAGGAAVPPALRPVSCAAWRSRVLERSSPP
ncbi:MAG: hypothetical protein HY812_13360 [Planctomycetes bacterium]|nr:hypothetical protein [Planctomycetota bacterium]